MRSSVAALAGLCLLAGRGEAQRDATAPAAYIFSITLPDSGALLSASVSIPLFHPRLSTDTLELNLVGLEVDSAFITDFARTRGWYTYDGEHLRVALPPNASSVTIYYHGTPRDGLIFGKTARGRPAVFADNWPERARFWLPTIDRPSDKAGVALSVRAPTGWRVVANGSMRGCTGATCTWVEDRSIPTYTMVLGATQFTVSNHRPVIDGTDTIPIQVWAYPEDSAWADSVPFRRATEIAETMQRLVGPFPYEKLAHVQAVTKFGGMENSSAIFYNEKAIVERRMRENTVRHETAHQWFGDAVTPRAWPHVWLSEGFASYFDCVIAAALDGDSALSQGMRRNAESYFASSVVERPMVDTAQHDPMQLLNGNAYQKGAWVLHMLRRQLGDSLFWRGMRDYYRLYRDSTAVSEDFATVMERASGQSLGWFFHQWLYQAGYPRLEVQWRQAGPGRPLIVGITEVQPPAWGVFRIPSLTLEFRDVNGAAVRKTVTLDVPRGTVVTVDGVPFTPTEVRVDPDGELLLQATVTRMDRN